VSNLIEITKPGLCRCKDAELDRSGLRVRDVLLRLRDRQRRSSPNLGAAIANAQRLVWSPEEDALYYALVEVGAAVIETLDRLERPQQP
jgi:hypothetical protein